MNMQNFYYYQDEKVIIWQRHTFMVSARTQEEADKFIRSNKLAESTDWHHNDMDGRLRYGESNELLETQEELAIEANQGKPTIEIFNIKKEPVADNCGNRKYLAANNLWREQAMNLLNTSFPDTTEEQKDGFLNKFWDSLSPDKHNLFNFEIFIHGGTPSNMSGSPELWAYIFHMDVLPRNASDAQIVAYYESDDNYSREYPIEKMTPDTFACRINDEMFNDQGFYVRFIKL